ncbi:MAG: tetratricopeptide repeat protein [Candidatus Omnitrophica bacterium]|nr:tetratricopeptide repeat protein [Candidatus Omnitrophota bacterium]
MKFTSPFVRAGLILIFVLLGLAAYGPSFHAGFQMDDMSSIINNDYLKNPFRVLEIWQYDGSRFLPHLSFAWNYHLHHYRLFPYHGVNFIFHLANAFLVMIFMRLILKSEKDIASSMAYFAGLIFLIHPIQTGAVTYIVQRATLMATFFYLATLVLFLWGRQKNKIVFIAAAWFFAVAAIFSKPMAFTLPFILILMDILFIKSPVILSEAKDLHRDSSAFGLRMTETTRRCILYLPFFLILSRTIFPHFATQAVTGRSVGDVGAAPQWQYLLTQINVIRTYVRLLFLPLGQNLDYDYPLAKTFWQPVTMASFCFLAGIFIAGLKLLSKYRILSFGIFWFFVTLSIESSLHPLKDVIFEHRLYLPMAGFALFLPYAAAIFLKDTKKSVLVLTLVVLIFSILTYKRNMIWADDISLWKDTVQKSPQKARPYNNLGLVYLRRGDAKMAMEYFQQAHQKDPKDAITYFNRGVAYEQQKEYDKALENYQKALEIEPGAVDFHNSLGAFFAERGKYDKATEHLQKAIEGVPHFAYAHKNLAWVYQKTGNLEMAARHYQKAVEIDPQFAAAYNGMGYVLGEFGDYEKAIAYYEQALRVGGVSVQALSNLAFAYNQIGSPDAALQYASKAVEYDSKNSQAHNNLGIAYAKKGNINVAIENFKKAIALQPDYAEAHMNLGAAYGIQGKFEKEIESYQEAIRLKPDYAQAYYNLGYSLEQQAKPKEAALAYKKVLQIMPAHNNARQGLARVESSDKS